jgi:hypothetical protein
MSGELPQRPSAPQGIHLDPDGWLPVSVPIRIENAFDPLYVANSDGSDDARERELKQQLRMREGMRNLRLGFKENAADAARRRGDSLVRDRASVERGTLLTAVNRPGATLDGTKLAAVAGPMEDLVDLRGLYDTGDVRAAKTEGFSAASERRVPRGSANRLGHFGTRAAAAIVLTAGLAAGAFGIMRPGGEADFPSANPVTAADAPSSTQVAGETTTSIEVPVPTSQPASGEDTKLAKVNKPPTDKQKSPAGTPARVDVAAPVVPGETHAAPTDPPKQQETTTTTGPKQPEQPRKTTTTPPVTSPETSAPPNTAVEGR